MLPVSLKLRNFLSYREEAPVLRLDDVHLACLCGANGHGKTALLDAITWALWGEARGSRHEQLIHQGQQEMSVELEFDSGGQRYLVVRRYSRARRSAQSALELSVATGDDTYRPITGDTIKETERELERLINMDYKTFVNSAFLLQGRADLFTMSTASARKEVLSTVLGLGLYDRLEERAKLHARELGARLETNDHELRRLEVEAARRDELTLLLAEADSALSSAGEAVAGRQARLDLLRSQVGHLERRRAESEELEAQMARVESRRGEAAQEAAELERRLSGWREAMGRADEITVGFAALGAAQAHSQTLGAASQRAHALERELFPLEQEITAARTSLKAEVAAQEKRLEADLTPRAGSLESLETELARVGSALAALDPKEAEVAGLVEQERTAELDARRLEDENARLTERGKETASKLALLDHGHEEGVACPICGSALAADGLERLTQNCHAEIEEQRQRFKAQAEQAKAADAEAARLHAQASERRQALDGERRRLDGQRAQLSVQRDDASRARDELAEATARLAQTKESLEHERFATGAQARAAELRAQVAEAGFDGAALADAERQVMELTHWEAEHQHLAEAEARLPEDEAALARATGRVTEATEELGRAEARRSEVARELTELPGYLARQTDVQQQLDAATQHRDGLQSHRGSLAHQLEQVTAAEAERKEHVRERDALVREVSVYEELARAFGKGGVQALLIEAAIPRLEDEANDLLRRMTDGRMSLKLETQRARRIGANAGVESVETLDIIIADELGTRSYEMFSGGERFRIDFALRIALSKLLAWRAGAPLPTLFIDEGFGTQDMEGRDRILEVIKAIEDKFERILVITHMEEVKEAFPVRIEVTRTAAGSTFSMS